MLHFRRETACRWFRRHLDDVAVDVDLPAVVETPQPGFLVAAERKRRAPMRTVLADDAEPPVGIAKHDEVFAEQPRAQRRTVRLGHFLRHANR